MTDYMKNIFFLQKYMFTVVPKKQNNSQYTLRLDLIVWFVDITRQSLESKQGKQYFLSYINQLSIKSFTRINEFYSLCYTCLFYCDTYRLHIEGVL